MYGIQLFYERCDDDLGVVDHSTTLDVYWVDHQTALENARRIVEQYKLWHPNRYEQKSKEVSDFCSINFVGDDGKESQVISRWLDDMITLNDMHAATTLRDELKKFYTHKT